MSIGAVFPLTKFPQFQFLHQGTFLYNLAAPSLLCNCNYNNIVANVTTTPSSVVNPNRSISTQPKPPKSASNNLDDALVSFNRMLKSRSIHSIYSINKLLGSIVKMGKYQTVLSLIKQLQLQGVPVDAYTINIGINCYCHLNRVDFGFSLLGSVFKLGYEPTVGSVDIACYNLLIDAACKDGKLEIAKELVNELFSNGLQPNERTYNAIIIGLCQEGSLDEAKELLTKMEDNGCFPSDVTYNIILRGFLKRNQMYEVMVLLEKMLESGFSPANSTIEMLVEVLPMREQDPTLLNMIRKLAPKDM